MFQLSGFYCRRISRLWHGRWGLSNGVREVSLTEELLTYPIFEVSGPNTIV